MKKRTIILIIITIFFIIYYTFPLFYGLTTDEYKLTCNDLEWLSTNKDVYKLKYMVSTGISWFVDDSTDEPLINEYVVVENVADPRFSTINKLFELDVNGCLFVVSDKKKKVDFLSEDVWCIRASEIYAYIPDEKLYKNSYSLSDMNFLGFVKYIIGFMYKPFHYSF